jgi:hypothetical protein
MSRIISPVKFLGETVLIPFDFISRLDPVETISSPSLLATTFSGTDANPALILSGSPVILGSVVTQKISGGTVGATYNILCTVNTSLGQILQLATFIAVVPDGS